MRLDSNVIVNRAGITQGIELALIQVCLDFGTLFRCRIANIALCTSIHPFVHFSIYMRKVTVYFGFHMCKIFNLNISKVI